MKFTNIKKLSLIFVIMVANNYLFAAMTKENNKSHTKGVVHGNRLHSESSISPKNDLDSESLVSATNGLNSQNNSGVVNPNTVVLNFENSDIQSTIKAISQLSGKNFVIDPRVKGTVTIVSDKPIAKSDSYKVLETALRMQGFAVVEGDGVIKVLPEADAKTYGMQTFSQGVSAKNQIGDQVITKIFIIEHGSAIQLANSLRPLIAPNNSISVYPNTNALIVTDYASNIKRIGKIINRLSSTSEVKSQPTIVQLKYSIAADVAQVLQSYLNNGNGGNPGGGIGGNGDGPLVTITVDSNNNSLIIYSTVQERINEVKNLALQLDHDTANNNNNLHVVYLKNADAAHIADVLRVVASGQDNPDLGASSSLAKFATEPTSMFQSSSSGGSSSGFGGGGSSQASSRPSNNRPSGSSGSPNGGKDQPKVFIQAEATTNALIIQAPYAIYRNLRMIIDMLDVRRAQIMIEAMIADINSQTTGQFGIQWAVAGGNNQLGAIGLGNYAGDGNSLTSIGTNAYQMSQMASGGAGGAGGASMPSLPGQMYIGLVTGTVTVGGQTIPTLGVLADMLAASSSANILSRPTLITLDNEEAKIMVGSNVPVPNGSYQNTAAQAGMVVNTFSRMDVGTFLDIKPLITQSGAIQLELYQEDSQIDTSTMNNPDGMSFLKRNMRATLLVDNGQIIAIGGMTKDSISIVKNGIPLLGDIPYIGWLFSWQTRVHLKQNLVLFLRPVIIRNADGYRALTNAKYQYIVDQQNTIQAKGNLLLPTINPVTLDNQVPYSKVNMPSQIDNTQVQTPLVDMRASKLNSNAKVIMPRDRGNNSTVMSPAK